jgi:hypothetical protein
MVVAGEFGVCRFRRRVRRRIRQRRGKLASVTLEPWVNLQGSILANRLLLGAPGLGPLPLLALSIFLRPTFLRNSKPHRQTFISHSLQPDPVARVHDKRQHVPFPDHSVVRQDGLFGSVEVRVEGEAGAARVGSDVEQGR